ncbi:MAG TPA: zinc finger domain-containing protein [Anaerolineaceae bacterium]|nr:zinc finger domain-containing protein [Anaerolineaceae bacterium]
MIELPEAQTLAAQISQHLSGKTIINSTAAHSPHKFAWYYGDPAEYPAKLNGGRVLSARGLGMFVEIALSTSTLLFNDGVNLRLHPQAGPIPVKHQLLLTFDDGSSLSASVAMYGGVVCWANHELYENSYYATALAKPSPLTGAFDEACFRALLAPDAVRKLPLKAALATEQRIPGLGNGCLQDILWQARLHPRKKLSTLTNEELHQLFLSLKSTFREMAQAGGRSTEKDLFGQPGGYPVNLCAATNGKPCPRCGSPIMKEAYLGGSVYICPVCQKL